MRVKLPLSDFLQVLFENDCALFMWHHMCCFNLFDDRMYCVCCCVESFPRCEQWISESRVKLNFTNCSNLNQVPERRASGDFSHAWEGLSAAGVSLQRVPIIKHDQRTSVQIHHNNHVFPATRRFQFLLGHAESEKRSHSLHCFW